jgi:signal transduction histidine kinase
VTRRSRSWTIAMAAFLLVSGVVALVSSPGYWLTCFSDTAAVALWAIAVLTMVRAAFRNRGRSRIFWIAFAASAVLASINLAAWTYYDIIARRPYPDPFWADIPLFLQPVPIMAALALQPHRRRESPKFYVGTLNFLLLLLWWVYLYSFRIFPHEYVVYNPESFNRYYNILYILEFLILLAIMGWFWMSTSGRWRRFYFQLFLATGVYTLAFQALNSALLRNTYYPGSFYDVIDNAATCFFIWIALTYPEFPAEQMPERPISLRWNAVWSMLSALAVLSVPAMGLWTLFQVHEPPALQHFRLTVTLVFSAILGFCVFLRQRLMDRRLVGLLTSSRETLDNLQRVQSELVRKERLGSLGQLVAGAAHEINNPLTAILGYSELLAASDSLSPEQGSVASDIARQARRASSLVSDLLNFARKAPSEKSVVDLGSLVHRAVQMESSNQDRRKVQIVAKLPASMPRVWGSTNELFQAFQQLVGGIADRLEMLGGGTLLVRALPDRSELTIEFSCLIPGGQPFPADAQPCGPAANKDSGLRFRAVHAIIENHAGRIVARDGAALLLMLPAHAHAATASATN